MNHESTACNYLTQLTFISWAISLIIFEEKCKLIIEIEFNIFTKIKFYWFKFWKVNTSNYYRIINNFVSNHIIVASCTCIQCNWDWRCFLLHYPYTIVVITNRVKRHGFCRYSGTGAGISSGSPLLPYFLP